MALKRFSVDGWLNENGYESPSADFSKQAANKTLDINRNGNNIDRFSVDSWLNKNGYESPEIGGFNVDYTPKQVQYLEPTTTAPLDSPKEFKGSLINNLAWNASVALGKLFGIKSEAKEINRYDITSTDQQKIKDTPLLERMGNTVEVVHDTVNQELTNLIGSTLSIPNDLSKMISTGNRAIYNASARASGTKELSETTPNNSLVRTAKDIAGSVGINTEIELDKVSNPYLKAGFKAWNEGDSFSRAVAQQNQAYLQPYIAEKTATIGSFGRVIVDMSASSVTNLQFLLPHGNYLFALNSLTNNVDKYVTGKVNAGLEWKTALGQTAVDVGTELMFGLFADTAGIFKGSQSKLRNLVNSSIPVTNSMLIGSVLKSGLEEGAEEVIAYPFQTYLQWQYDNPEKEASVFLKSFKYNVPNGISYTDWERAGLLGFISGGILSSFSAIQSKSNTISEADRDAMIKESYAILNELNDGTNISTAGEFLQTVANKAKSVFQPLIEQKKTQLETKSASMTDSEVTAEMKKINSELELNGLPPLSPAITGDRPAIDSTIEQQFTNDTQTETFDQKMADMASKEPSANIQGVVSSPFADMVKDIPVSNHNKAGYKGVFDSEVQKQIDDSMSIKHDKSLADRITDLKSFVTRTFLRGSVNIPYDQGELRQRIQSYRQANTAADTNVENYILRIYNPVGKQNFKLMQNAVIFLDIKEDILDKKLYSDDVNKQLPFGIKSVNDALQMIADVEAQLKDPKNSLVVKALNERRQTMDIIRKQLASTAREVGWDLSYLENRSDYMHHAIMEYIDESSREKHRTGVKSTAYKGREGSYKNYVSDPALADYLVLRKMFKDMMKIGVYQELKTLDIKDTLPLDQEGKYIIKDGYAEFDRRQMGLNYIEHTLEPEYMAAAFAQNVADGLAIPSLAIQMFNKNAQDKHNDNVIVIPIDVRDAVVKEFEIQSTKNQAINLQRMAVQAWKKWQLESPRRFFKYNVKNMAGDTDALLMIHPSGILKLKKSFTELTDLYKNGKISKQLSEYANFGGLSTSLSTVELGDLPSLPHFTFYESESNVGKLAINKFRRIVQGIDKFTEWREQLLRYSDYMQRVEELSKSPNGLPKDYGASKMEEIKSIKTINGRAFKLQNDALGAYNDVTPMSQGMSKNIAPFFRFVEVNNKRFFRLAMNTFKTDTDTTMKVGESMANKFAHGAKVTSYAALRIGKIGLGYLAFTTALALFNNLAAPDEEKELPEDVRNSIHIVFPRWANPNGEIMYFNDMSSFYQLFNYMGFDGPADAYNDLKEVINGKMPIGDKVKEIATATTSSFLNGMAPFYKPVMEAIVGKSIYPDISKPSTVRDPWEHIFKSVALDNEYRLAVGKPLPDGSYLKTFQKAFVNSVVPGEAALWDVYDMKERYYSSIGKTGYSGSSRDPKATAIYNYKVALKLGDTQAAEQSLKQYAIYGGTKATFKASMSALDPLFGMSTVDKSAFVKGLTEDERLKYNTATEYYKSIQALGDPSDLPATKKK